MRHDHSSQAMHRLEHTLHMLHRMGRPLRLRRLYGLTGFHNAGSALRVGLSILLAQLFELPRVRRLLPLCPVRALRMHEVAALLDPA